MNIGQRQKVFFGLAAGYSAFSPLLVFEIGQLGSRCRVRQNDPDGYRSHPKTKLLASVHKAVTRTVPANPDHPDFRVGKTLGSEHANWRRVEQGMPGRYRLFFRFASRPVKAIVYVWFNDEDTLPQGGFENRRLRGIPPDARPGGSTRWRRCAPEREPEPGLTR